jgi:hypothetical protein
MLGRCHPCNSVDQDKNKVLAAAGREALRFWTPPTLAWRLQPRTWFWCFAAMLIGQIDSLVQPRQWPDQNFPPEAAESVSPLTVVVHSAGLLHGGVKICGVFGRSRDLLGRKRGCDVRAPFRMGVRLWYVEARTGKCATSGLVKVGWYKHGYMILRVRTSWRAKWEGKGWVKI